MSTSPTSNCSCGESCGQSCGKSCSESCSDSCNQACNQACNNFCNSFCSQACTCSNSSTETGAMLASNVSIVLINYIFGLLNGFNSKTPLLLTLIGSSLLALSLLGFRGFSKRKALNKYQKGTYFLIFNRITILHSHHSQNDISNGKEFKFKNKFFCTGCYGLFSGTIIALILLLIYLNQQTLIIPVEFIGLILPLFFGPILLRYSIYKAMKSFMRFMANAFVPIGCSLLLIISDSVYQDWILNSLLVGLILVIALLRGYISTKA